MRTDDEMTATEGEPGRRGRRRAVLAMAATAVGVAAAIGGSTLLFSPDGSGAAAAGGDALEGRRLVGIGHAAIAVPAVWATNAHSCGTPQRDTVIIDLASVCLAGVARPAAVESVEIRQGEPAWPDDVVVSDVEIAGERARRSATTCVDGSGARVYCWAALYLPEHDVEFRAESSTGAAQVDEILGWIRVVEDRVAVPGPRTISERAQEKGQVTYLEALRRAGLAAELVPRKTAGLRGGFLIGTTPAAGTMLASGETVTVVVRCAGPAPNDSAARIVGGRWD